MNEGLFFHLFATISEDGKTAVFSADWQVFVFWGAYLLCLLACYLLGSLNSAVIVSRLLHGEDIRSFGSGNAGMTNMMRTYGKKEAGLTLLGDTLKMVVALLLTGALFGFNYNALFSWNYLLYIAGFACMMGHIKPIFYHFKGGKGVLCYAMMGLILAPIPFLFILICFFLIVAVSKYISLGSIVCAGFFPLVLQGYMQIFLPDGRFDGMIFLATLISSAVLIYCHRSNLSRLINHTENKFSLKKKEKPAPTLPEKEAEADDE